MGDNAGIEGMATWKWREKLTFNQKEFQHAEQALFEKYKRKSGSRYFDLAEGILTRAGD